MPKRGRMYSTTVSTTATFHGWKILGLCTFGQLVSVGFTVYLIGVFIRPLSEAFAVSTTQLGWGAAIFYSMAALTGPLLGYWVDKGKVKAVVTLGGVFLASGFWLLSLSQNLTHAALVCLVFLAPGASMVGVVPCNAMIVCWFQKRRGLALGVAAAGISLGGFLMPPVAAGLITNFGWREALAILGSFIALTLIPLAWFIAVSKPSELGQYPDGEEPSQSSAQAAIDADDLTFKKILLRKTFWLITFSVGLLSFCSVLMITYVIPFAQERGLATQSSAFLLSLYAGSAFFGKFAIGWLADKVPAQRMMTLILLLAAIGWWPMIILKTVTGLAISSIIVGFAVGGLMPLWATLIAIYFGTNAYGRVKGVMSLAMLSCSVFPAPLGGYLHDTYGSYAIGFSWVWWVLPVGIICSLLLPNTVSKSN